MNLKQAKELVRGRLSDKRYEHTLNVRKMAVKLAKRYGVDEDKAALAALLHPLILRLYPEIYSFCNFLLKAVVSLCLLLPY